MNNTKLKPCTSRSFRRIRGKVQLMCNDMTITAEECLDCRARGIIKEKWERRARGDIHPPFNFIPRTIMGYPRTHKDKLWAEYRRLDQPGRKVIMKAILDTEV